MALHIDRRRFDRPDRPQPVYTGALNLFEAFRYVPIGAATRTFRSADRISDRTFILQTVPSFAWVDKAADAVIATWAPVFEAEDSYRSAERPRLDVRSFDSRPQDGWMFTNLPSGVTVAQQWPAILQTLAPSYRSAERAKLDVRQYEWAPELGWIGKAADLTVAKWAPVFAAELGYRSADRAVFDVRRQNESPESGWISGVATRAIASWMPAFSAETSTGTWTRSGPSVDVRDATAAPESLYTATIPVVVFNPAWATNSNRTIGMEILPE